MAGAGFTLLEIVISLSIVALLMGGSIAFLVINRAEARLRRTSGSVEGLAKRARTIAVLRQTPYALEFHNGRVRLSPLVEAGIEDPEDLPQLSADDDWPEEEGGADRPLAPVRDEIVFDEEMVVGVRRWGSDDWVVFDNERNRMTWRFDPNGLCEPISVRFEVDDGESWLEQQYHPLTASVRDYTMTSK